MRYSSSSVAALRPLTPREFNFLPYAFAAVASVRVVLNPKLVSAKKYAALAPLAFLALQKL